MVRFGVSQSWGKQTVQTTSSGKATVDGPSNLDPTVPEAFHVDIQLIHLDGTPRWTIPHAEKLALRYCENDNECFVDYDWARGRVDAQIRPYDLILSLVLVSGITRGQIRDVMERRDKINAVLRKIPADAHIAEAQPGTNLRKAVGDLWEAMTFDKFSFSRFSKTLHKKRPNLIPVVDRKCTIGFYMPSRVVAVHNNPAAKASCGSWLAIFDQIRVDVCHNLEPLRNNSQQLAKHGFGGVSEVRALDMILWEMRRDDPTPIHRRRRK